MKPFKRIPRQKKRKRHIIYKKLFYTTLIVFMCYVWYKKRNPIEVNNNKHKYMFKLERTYSIWI